MSDFLSYNFDFKIFFRLVVVRALRGSKRNAVGWLTCAALYIDILNRDLISISFSIPSCFHF